MEVARSYLRATFELGLVAFVVAVVVAFPIGVLSAVRRNSVLDHAAMGLALVGQSAPTFFIGILLILVLALRLDLFPTSGRGTGGISSFPPSRWARSRWPRSPGSRARPCSRSSGPTSCGPPAPRGSPRPGWWKHTLRNAALPILTITGLQFGTLLGGAVTETVFAWPGIGRLAIQSIYNRDYPVVQSTVFIAAVLFIAINLALDVLYGVLDPRARVRRRGRLARRDGGPLPAPPAVRRGRVPWPLYLRLRSWGC